MRQVAVSIQQIRRWSNPQAWMVEGYSSSQDVYYFHEAARQCNLQPGGWTLKASDLLRIEWDGPPDQECMYYIHLNQERLYRSLWTPRLLETITESFFASGDLLVINYRLLKVMDL